MAHVKKILKPDAANVIENNLVDLYRTFSDMGGGEWRVYDHIKVMTSHVTDPNMNYIFLPHQQRTDGEQLNMLLQELSQENNQYTVVAPRKHNQVKDVLDTHGFNSGEDIWLMGLDLPHWQEIPLSHSYQFSLVTDKKAFIRWCDISDQAFELEAGTNYRFFEPMFPNMDSDIIKCFSVHYENNAVGVALVYIDNQNQSIGNYWWGVLPSYQHLGLETFLIYHIIEQAKWHDLRFAFAQCLETSKNLAEHLEFKNFGEAIALLK